mgnify:CR=1 FL=1
MSGLALPKPERRGPKARKPILRSAAPRRSAKRLPRVTQTERGKEEARLNALFSRVIRLRDPRCVIGRCGIVPMAQNVSVRISVNGVQTGTAQTSDAAHLFPKGSHPRLRWDLRNAAGACRDCHTFIDSHKAEREAFIKSRLNVHDWEDLMRIHLSGPSPDRAEVRATLTAALRRFSQEL